MPSPLTGEGLLLLGGTGFLGRVIAARLLTDTDCPILLPVRSRHEPAQVLAAIAAEDPRLSVEVVSARCQVVPLPSDLVDLAPQARAFGVRGLLNCAGSVAYFNRDALIAGNESLTEAAIALGRALEVEHFTYLSTAFCSGFRQGPIHETLHSGPAVDPTYYTTSKRNCEQLVAASGLPWLITRPSIVMGDSRSGHYTGRPYGIYQLWRGWEKLLLREPRQVAHGMGSSARLQIVHQDAVAQGTLAALRDFQPGRILHLVGNPETLPRVRDCWRLWFESVVRPETAHFHATLADANSHDLSPKVRTYLEITATNLLIAEQPWDFQTQGLEELGLPRPQADLHTLARCQEAFIARSPRLQAYRAAGLSPDSTP